MRADERIALTKLCLLVAALDEERAFQIDRAEKTGRDLSTMCEANERLEREYNALNARRAEEVSEATADLDRLRRTYEADTALLSHEIQIARAELEQWRTGERKHVSPVSQPVSDEDKQVIT